MRIAFLAASLLANGFTVVPIGAQSRDRPSFDAVPMGRQEAADFELDGLLTEEVWDRAQPATGFRQREPREGVPATERTEVRVAYDGSTLYVGVLAWDTEPDAIVARILQRDQVLGGSRGGSLDFEGDDVVAIVFDTFRDRRNGVVFATNPNGAEYDALLTDEDDLNVDWRGIWEVAAQRTPEGWSAEFAIPFRTLRYRGGTGSQSWGFNVVRFIPHRDNEESLWTSWSRDNEGLLRVSRAGELSNLRNLPSSSANIEIKPYLLSGASRTRNGLGDFETDERLDAGLDFKWEVKPGLLLDLTVNTDFAQVEVDDEQVNLTRFDLFFPEKRDFFLENAGIFEFGEGGFGGPPFLMFFSRRIGISEDEEEEVPVLGGARLTGRLGSGTVGLLNVVTDEHGILPRTNFAVARYKKDVGRSSYLGAMVTDRRSSGSTNTVAGADARLWLTATMRFEGYAARSFTEEAGGDDEAYRAALDMTGDHMGFILGHSFIGSEFNADMGFVTRTGIRRTNGFFRVTSRPPALGIRQIRTWVSGEVVTDPDGNLLDWDVGPNASIDWLSGDNLRVEFQQSFVTLAEEFDLPEDVIIPVGEYDNWKLEVSGRTSDQRSVVLSSRLEWEGFFGGDASSVGGSLRVAPNSHLSLSTSYTRNTIDVPQGSLVSDITRVRVTYAFSTKLVLNALIQHNSLDNEISANVRLNFIHRPGSDLFVVYNEDRGSDDSLWDVQTRGAVLKLTYLARI